MFLKQRCFTNRVWKEGRGIWYGVQNRVLVVVNEEEHIKVICQKFGGDLWAVLSTLKGLLLEIENFLGKDGYEFMRTHHYGYLVSRPLELGTSLRVSVNVKLPLTAKVMIKVSYNFFLGSIQFSSQRNGTKGKNKLS